MNGRLEAPSGGEKRGDSTPRQDPNVAAGGARPSDREPLSAEGAFGRVLAEAEARCGSPEGAAAVWGDGKTLPMILEALRRPASGSLYTQWAQSAELRCAARAASALLQAAGGRPDAVQLQRAVAAAAQASLAVNADAGAAVAGCLHAAELGAAGMSSLALGYFLYSPTCVLSLQGE